jgi:hypothetical protein
LQACISSFNSSHTIVKKFLLHRIYRL